MDDTETIRCVSAVVRDQATYLNMNRIELADARQGVLLWIWEHKSEFNPTKSAWSTWVQNMTHSRIIDFCRFQSRKCRRLPAGMSAPPHEANNLEAEDVPDCALPDGMNTEQLVRYLMVTGKGMKRKAFDGSPYPPLARLVIVLLCGRLGMGARAMAGFIRENPAIQRALGLTQCPCYQNISRWMGCEYRNEHSAVRTLRLNFR